MLRNIGLVGAGGGFAAQQLSRIHFPPIGARLHASEAGIFRSSERAYVLCISSLGSVSTFFHLRTILCCFTSSLSYRAPFLSDAGGRFRSSLETSVIPFRTKSFPGQFTFLKAQGISGKQDRSVPS
jgi:hypothetical protein